MTSPPDSKVRTCGALGVSVIVLFAVALTQVRLQAYVDPGTGSYLFQLAAAGLLAGLYTVKRYWHAIRAAFRGSSWRGKHDVKPSGRDGVE